MLIPPGWREIVRDRTRPTRGSATAPPGPSSRRQRSTAAAACCCASPRACRRTHGACGCRAYPERQDSRPVPRPRRSVRPAGTPTRTTPCGHCRGTAEEVPPRPAWRRHRAVARETPDPRASDRSYRSCSVVDDVLTDEDLTALMEGPRARRLARGTRRGRVRHAVPADQGRGLERADSPRFHAPAAAAVRRASPAAPVGGRDGLKPRFLTFLRLMDADLDPASRRAVAPPSCRIAPGHCNRLT